MEMIIGIGLIIGWILSFLWWFFWGEFCYNKWSDGRDATPKALIFTLLGGLPPFMITLSLLIIINS